MAINLTLNFQQVVGTESAPLVTVRDWTEFTDGKKGRRIGTSYEILLLNSGCLKLTVKVEDTVPAVTQEELDKRNTSMNFMLVKFDGFHARPYSDRNGQIQLSAKADKIILCNNNIGTGATK